VDPAVRRQGIAAELYERFFGLARRDGRKLVKAITADGNQVSIAFHRRMGFQVSEAVRGCDRPGVAHVVFTRELRERPR